MSKSSKKVQSIRDALDASSAGSAEELRARDEKLVHEEPMHASVGDVLEHAHEEEAVRLLYLKDELPMGAPEQTASTPREQAAPEPRVFARETSEKRAEDASPRAARLRRLSPLFWLRASRAAAHELREGLRRASQDLKDAVSRARHSFV